ncbi:hypothetical protein H8E88_34695 [candidate division KSB1 bacterium]|nr:hypothetical protein [candidate division KSB1 bacterium]
MKTRLNRLHRIGYSNKTIASKLNLSIEDFKNLNHNDNKFLDLIKEYNKKIADE